MSTVVVVSHECGFQGRYDSPARAEYYFSRHSCAKARRERAAAERGRAREAAVDRTPRPCRHKVANHVHGTYPAYVLDRCRCVPCAAANAAYKADATRRRAYGTWSPYVPTAPAVEHVRALQAAGMGWKRIAAAAGLAVSTVYPLLFGQPARRRGPRTKARREVVDALLAVPMPTLDDLGGGTIVDGTGTARRLQALVTLGWSVDRIAAESGAGDQALRGALTGRPVIARTARAVRAAYDVLWDTPPPQDTRGGKVSVARSRNWAHAQGWAPPLAWDEETIDDPTASPAHQVTAETPGVDQVSVDRAIAGDRVDLTRAERWVAIERLAATGMSDQQIAARLDVTDKTILRDRQALGIPSTWKAAS